MFFWIRYCSRIFGTYWNQTTATIRSLLAVLKNCKCRTPILTCNSVDCFWASFPYRSWISRFLPLWRFWGSSKCCLKSIWCGFVRWTWSLFHFIPWGLSRSAWWESRSSKLYPHRIFPSVRLIFRWATQNYRLLSHYNIRD